MTVRWKSVCVFLLWEVTRSPDNYSILAANMPIHPFMFEKMTDGQSIGQIHRGGNIMSLWLLEQQQRENNSECKYEKKLKIIWNYKQNTWCILLVGDFNLLLSIKQHMEAWDLSSSVRKKHANENNIFFQKQSKTQIKRRKIFYTSVLSMSSVKELLKKQCVIWWFSLIHYWKHNDHNATRWIWPS